MREKKELADINDYCDWCCFIAREISELSPDLVNYNEISSEMGKALKRRSLAAVRRGYKDLVDWVNHLDVPYKDLIRNKFMQRFGMEIKFR